MDEAILSRDKARREESWNRLEKGIRENERVTGAIVGRVKGGFTVDLDGALRFCRAARSISARCAIFIR